MNNQTPAGGLFGDGSCFYKPREPVEPIESGFEDAIDALREQRQAEIKARQVEGRLEAVRAILDKRLALGDEYAERLNKQARRSRRCKRAFQAFKLWCEHFEVPYLPAAPETIALYMLELHDAGLSASRLKRIRDAIRHV